MIYNVLFTYMQSSTDRKRRWVFYDIRKPLLACVADAWQNITDHAYSGSIHYFLMLNVNKLEIILLCKFWECQNLIAKFDYCWFWCYIGGWMVWKCIFFYILSKHYIIQAGSKKYLSLALPLSIRNSIAQTIFLLATTY